MTEPGWRPDWPAIADFVVNRSLRLRPLERVVYLVDPTVQPDCFESIRAAVLQAGGIEQATMLGWTSGLAHLRRPDGRHPSVEVQEAERQAHLALLQTADVFMWLPTEFFRSGGVTSGESEWILGTWPGRGIHLHWFPDMGSPPGDPIHQTLAQIYQRAILDLDYAALRATQQQVVEAVRGKTLRITTPDGTDLSFQMSPTGWYHRNDGDASPEKALGATCARDREEELPCGAVRIQPISETVQGVIALRDHTALIQSGVDMRQPRPLDMVFRDGRIIALQTDGRPAQVDPRWDLEPGAKDWFGELTIGTNPLLETPPGARLPTYFGLGEGVLKLQVGDNVESGGRFASDIRLNIFATDATVTADAECILQRGRLLIGNSPRGRPV